MWLNVPHPSTKSRFIYPNEKFWLTSSWQLNFDVGQLWLLITFFSGQKYIECDRSWGACPCHICIQSLQVQWRCMAWNTLRKLGIRWPYLIIQVWKLLSTSAWCFRSPWTLVRKFVPMTQLGQNWSSVFAVVQIRLEWSNLWNVVLLLSDVNQIHCTFIMYLHMIFYVI